jgi:Ca-activated chloride channel family protein
MVMIQTDVDEDMLGKIADETGGKFFRATDTDALQAIYGQIDRMEKTEHAVKKFEHYRELFTWVLIPALVLLALELALAQTRYRRLPA